MSENPLLSNAQYHPNSSWLGSLIKTLVHSNIIKRARRVLSSKCPLPVLRSDVRDVIYATWWVPVNNLPAPPIGFQYVERSGLTPFTILTYQHGNLGPKALGKLRRLFLSPKQSNWRLYVTSTDTQQPSVLFTHNALDSLMHVVGARLSTDAMQAQCAMIKHHWGNASFSVEIDHPNMMFKMFGQQSPRFSPPPHMSVLEAMDQLVQQEWALSVTSDGLLCHSNISMDVDFSRLIPLKTSYWSCPFVEQFSPQGDPMVFVLPEVPFEVLSEKLWGLYEK